MQLSVYALAAREVFDWNPSRLTLLLLADQHAVSATRDDKKLNKVRAEIQEAAADIRAGEFPAKPGFRMQVLRLRIHLPGAGARRGGQRFRGRVKKDSSCFPLNCADVAEVRENRLKPVLPKR